MQESRRLLCALPLRVSLALLEVASTGAADAGTRLAALFREASKAKDKEFRSQRGKEQFANRVLKDIEKL